MAGSSVPTPAQLRAARGLLGWSQTDLAEAAGVSLRTIKSLELAPDLEPLPGRPATIGRLVRALSVAGVRLTHRRGALGVVRTLPEGSSS
ncbi:MAG TPA: helix-turn-helix domain-containing protein [Roseomonas sp.]|jgi:predicted transcriptional regulator